jgi:hypothetical protein
LTADDLFGEDDLGFDPFHETQKALAEMIESESKQVQTTGSGRGGVIMGVTRGRGANAEDYRLLLFWTTPGLRPVNVRQFSPIGRLLTLDNFVKITEIAQIIGLLFSTVKVVY